MRPEPFPVVSITESMILQDEPMGSKDKFWCQLPAEAAGGGRWLFKEPRQEPEKMEHLAEKIARELAALMGVSCARVELADYEGVRGTISLDVQGPGEVLVHGNEIIAGRVMGYDLTQRRKTTDHTFERIRRALLEVCKGTCDEDLRQFAGYLVLDALIGNTDRHHENWALLRREAKEGVTYRLAPSFDHASSLGREMTDARRLLLLRENRLDAYVQHGPGAIYLAELGEKAIPPVELVRRLATVFQEPFQPWFPRLEYVTDEAVAGILSQIPEGWISEAQRRFAMALVRTTRQILTGFSG